MCNFGVYFSKEGTLHICSKSYSESAPRNTSNTSKHYFLFGAAHSAGFIHKEIGVVLNLEYVWQLSALSLCIWSWC